MRWKFLVIVSMVLTLVASLLWCGSVVVFFGPVRIIDFGSLWFLSFVIPLGLSFAAGFFVYRHTSRRRKLQAAVATMAVMLITAAVIMAAPRILPQYLTIPRTRGTVTTLAR